MIIQKEDPVANWKLLKEHSIRFFCLSKFFVSEANEKQINNLEVKKKCQINSLLIFVIERVKRKWSEWSWLPTQPKAQSRMPHRDESLEFRTGCKEFELIITLWFDSFYLNFGFLISRYYVANTISAHFLFSAFYHGIFYFLKMKRNRKKEKKNAAKTIHAYKKEAKSTTKIEFHRLLRLFPIRFCCVLLFLLPLLFSISC